MVCAWLFAISGFSQAQTITVTSPNGGEVNILLFSGAQRVGTIQNNVPVAAVSFSWVVGNYQGGTAAPGTNYKIKVRKPGTQIMDDSDRRFTISAVPLSASLTVTSPNGGETWRTEAAHQIRWTSSGVPGDVTIRLKKGGSVVTSRAAENIGIAYWFCSGVQAATDHKIRVENSTGSVFDESDHNFTI